MKHAILAAALVFARTAAAQADDNRFDLFCQTGDGDSKLHFRIDLAAKTWTDALEANSKPKYLHVDDKIIEIAIIQDLNRPLTNSLFIKVDRFTGSLTAVAWDNGKIVGKQRGECEKAPYGTSARKF